MRYTRSLFNQRDCHMSPCRTWRYRLDIQWDQRGLLLMVIGLNPSTADEHEDDPTIRRCIRFARDWGMSGLRMTNLFAFRATDPMAMMEAADPIGPGNTIDYLRDLAGSSHIVLAAWGSNGSFRDRDCEIYHGIPNLLCLGMTKSGQPRHPLYIKATTRPYAYQHPRY